MKSKTTKRYRARFAQLPRSVQAQANDAYRKFAEDPFRRSLAFKPVHATKPYWSARVGLNHRVVGVRDRDEIVWFWIGSHAEYDDLVSRL